MGMKIGPLLERARAVQREQQDEERAALRSEPVPFVPERPPPGWQDLEADVAEMFADLGGSAAADEALWRLAAWRRRNRSTTSVTEFRRRCRLTGRCYACREPATHGRALCEACREALRARSKQLREMAATEGRCEGCPAPAAPGRRRCNTCAGRRRAADRARREQQQRAGLCTYGRCPDKPTRGEYCTKHAEAKAAGTRKWQEKKGKIEGKKQRETAAIEGRCPDCSAPVTPGRRNCNECRDRKRATVRASRQQQERAGLCTHGRCPDKPTRGKYCTKHAEANVARAKRWQEKVRPKGNICEERQNGTAGRTIRGGEGGP
jgi:hypothetical protein